MGEDEEGTTGVEGGWVKSWYKVAACLIGLREVLFFMGASTRDIA